MEAGLQIAAENHYAVVHAFEDPMVMAGQGTIGCEILEDLADVDTVIIPMGGGGLISGIATAIKETKPSVRVVGAEPTLTPKYFHSRIDNERTSLPLKNTIADGLRISVPGQNPYPIIERYVDEIVLVEDEHIIEGMRMLAKDAKLIAEPAASIAIGALLAKGLKVTPREKVCVVLTGGNWDLCDLAEVYRTWQRSLPSWGACNGGQHRQSIICRDPLHNHMKRGSRTCHSPVVCAGKSKVSAARI